MEPEKKTSNNWLALINIPFQMGLIIFVFSYLGNWLDEKFQNPNETYFKVVTLLGVFVAIFQVIRQVNQINKNK